MVKYFYNGIKENILNGDSLKRIYEKYARILM